MLFVFLMTNKYLFALIKEYVLHVQYYSQIMINHITWEHVLNVFLKIIVSIELINHFVIKLKGYAIRHETKATVMIILYITHFHNVVTTPLFPTQIVVKKPKDLSHFYMRMNV